MEPFQVHSDFERRRDFPCMYRLCQNMHSLSNYYILYHSGTLVITDEPTVTHYYHYLKSIVLYWVHSCSCLFYEFGHITIIVIRYRINLLPPQILCTPFVHLPSSSRPQSRQPLNLLLFPAFLSQKVTQLESHSVELFQLGYSHLLILIEISSMSVQGLIAHCFLALNNIPLFKYTMFTYLLQDILVSSQFYLL